MENNKFIELEKEIKEWIGTPYRHLTAKKGCGADCALFVANCLKNVGILKTVDSLYYSRSWMVHGTQELLIDSFRKHLQDYLEEKYKFVEIDVNNRTFPLRGDVVVFRSLNYDVGHHACICLGLGKMVHSYLGKGVCYSNLMPVWWQFAKKIFRIEEK